MGNFHDINSAGFFEGKKKGPEKHKKRITGVDDYDDAPVEEKWEPEVRLISAGWVSGPKGFDHYDSCFVEVKGEYLKKTIRARIKGRLFCIYDGVEEDLNYEIEGWLNKDTGIARMKIGKLWFANQEHHKAWYNDKSTKAEYIVKGIFHTRGQNTIDSPVLKMPVSNKKVLRISIDINPDDPKSQDDVFRLFSTDEKASYSKVLTVKDDRIAGNETLDLEFTDLPGDLTYTLEVNPGGGEKTYPLFERKTIQELSNG